MGRSLSYYISCSLYKLKTSELIDHYFLVTGNYYIVEFNILYDA